MELSFFLAQLFALLYLSLAVGLFFGKLDLEKLFDDLISSPALLYIGSVMALVGGMLMVRYHNIWVGDWRVILTLFGWAGIIKGVLLMAFPSHASMWKGFFQGGMLKVLPWGTLILGLLFAYFGFMM